MYPVLSSSGIDMKMVLCVFFRYRKKGMGAGSKQRKIIHVSGIQKRKNNMSQATTASGRSQQPAAPEQKIRRREDPVFITGRGQYVGDIRRPGMLSICFVRSLYPRARIVAIDVQQAQAHPGVVTVVTGADTAHLGGLLTNLFPGSAWVPQPAMAREEVNYAGEPVAAVVAESEI